MPELPEVELYTRYFAAHALHQTIRHVVVRDPRILGATTAARLRGALAGRRFERVRRHGKHLFADSGKLWLHLHFGMTGDLAFYRAAADETRFARMVIGFAGGDWLAYDDMRLFGVVDLTPSPDEYIAAHALGPDALDPTLTVREFKARLAGRRGAIKALLMSQVVVAGLGNLYVDEALFASGIHPGRSAQSISPAEATALFRQTRQILRNVIERKAAGLTWPPRYLIPHRDEGGRCPRCGGEIRRTVVGGRTTFYCGRHQK
jgi:formamidopyrimidine-DNA glycosylase